MRRITIILAASLSPNFALHDKEMLQFGAGFGWNATRHLYLGAGTSWIQYFGDANALPVYFNPRLYFANKPGRRHISGIE